jgi:hypothetical protein
MNPENEEGQTARNLEPFPRPQTIPAGWDTSELLTSAPPEPETVVETLPEAAD